MKIHRVRLTAMLLAVASLMLMAVSACKQGNGNATGTEATTEVSQDELEALAAVLPKYSYVNNFHEGLAVVCDAKTDLCGYIDRTGREVIPCQFFVAADFCEGMARVMFNEGHNGFIDHEGNVVMKFGDTQRGYTFHDGLLCFCDEFEGTRAGDYVQLEDGTLVGGLLGFFDKKGNVAIAADTYEVAYHESGDADLTDFHDGLCRVWKQGQTSFIDTKGQLVFDCNYLDCSDFSDGLCRVSNDDLLTGYLDKSGHEVIPCRYTLAGDFSEGHAFAVRDGRLIIIDRKGNETPLFDFDATPFNFDEIDAPEPFIGKFSEGLGVAIRDGKFGYVDTEGNIVIPFRYPIGQEEYYYTQTACDFHEGLALVYDSQKKCGFIDREGNQVIPCRFDSGEEMSEGLAAVVLDGRYGYVTADGRCTFDLGE